MVDENAHPEFADKSADVFDIYLADDQSADSCRQQLLGESFAMQEDLTILTRTELRRHILSMVRNLYGLAYAQEAVVALVAIVGIAASLIVSTMQRQRELGFLRAQGATRGQIILLVLAEAIVLSFSGAIIGILLGLGLDWYTLNVILSEETGFPLAFESPSFEILLACLVSVIAAVVAGIGPARHAAWQPISIVTASE
jgi:ABC-type antimicrobial peptide transport system permease subunit